MTGTRIAQLVWLAIGIAAGFAGWILATGVLLLLGFSFASVIYAPYLELTMWIIAAFISWRRVAKADLEAARLRALPLLAGMLLPTLYVLIAMAITHP
jgi:hypothetical protein